MNKAKPYHSETLDGDEAQRTFTGDHLLQIAMPLGGIGAGCICLNGHGGLQDFSIRHKPYRTALPDKHARQDAGFALLHIKQMNITKLVEGPMPTGKIYAQGLKSQGSLGGGFEGFPRFRDCSFRGEYPFGYVFLSDPDLPLEINIIGFSPFIPLDVKNSAIPCAILEYTLKNTSTIPVDYEFSFHLSHLAYGADIRGATTSRNAVIEGSGILFGNEEDPSSETYGSASLNVIGYKPRIKAMWFRGGGFDAMSALWREVSTGEFRENDGKWDGDLKGRNGGSILLDGSLAPGESVTYPILITWHFPNVHFSIGRMPEGQVKPEEIPEIWWKEFKSPIWRPYYVSHWENARDVAEYVHENYGALRARTQFFHDAFFDSTLPSYVLDAISANLAIIKSPTIILQENGNMWAWEGCSSDCGCCHGSCTHVWNYAQAIPHLFPVLERTLRQQELSHSMDEQGHVTFRSALPDGPAPHFFHAASDGQLGGLMKVYREWQISGDQDWLMHMYPLAKRSLDYCIRTWDPKHKGVLEEPHHNTYDIEFWGPDGMCTSFYLGALAAMASMARDSGHEKDAPFYEELGRKGAEYLDQHLFNGEYFEQKVTYDGLEDMSFGELIAGVSQKSPYELQLLQMEGPKYQYGSGCISDGVVGAWLASICWVDTPQTKENIRKNLQAIFQHNFKESLWDHANPQRPGYALGDEPGLLLCTWPKGGKPTLPFIYSDEVWTGIEYQVASHLISEGFVEEGLTIVKALRSRYDGRVRNPWDEYECGSYYARAMASYDLLRALSGFEYSAAKKMLKFGPMLYESEFRTFFSTARGWGTIRLEGKEISIEMLEGEIPIDTIMVTLDGKRVTYETDLIARQGEVTLIRLP